MAGGTFAAEIFLTFLQNSLDKFAATHYNIKGNDASRTLRRRHDAGVAQLAEQLICNQQVDGSIPFASSIWESSRVAKGGRL